MDVWYVFSVAWVIHKLLLSCIVTVLVILSYTVDSSSNVAMTIVHMQQKADFIQGPQSNQHFCKANQQCFSINICLTFLHCVLPAVFHHRLASCHQSREEARKGFSQGGAGVKKCFFTSPHSHAHCPLQKGPQAKKVPKKKVPTICSRASLPSLTSSPSLTQLSKTDRCCFVDLEAETRAEHSTRSRHRRRRRQRPADSRSGKIFRYFSQIFPFSGNVFCVKNVFPSIY